MYTYFNLYFATISILNNIISFILEHFRMYPKDYFRMLSKIT